MTTEAAEPILHQLYAHLCAECGEGNMYYDEPEGMACDHCGAWCEALAIGSPFVDAVLDPLPD